MASIWKHPKSRFWYARYLGPDGRWRNASTKTTERKAAMKLADEYEGASKARRTATQARRVLSRLHAEITGEALPSSSVRAFVANWLREKRGTSKSTQAFYLNSATKFLAHLDALADDELSMVAKEHIVSFRNAMLEKLSAKATNHHLKVVKMLFRAARRDGFVVDDPSEFVETIREKKADKKRRRPFSLDEIRAVLAVADDEWRSMILFGLYTGQRIGDVARLTWANVDLDKSQVRLVTQKTGAALRIAMTAPLRAHIETLPAPDARPDCAPLHPRACALLERNGKSGTLSNQFADLLALAGLRMKKAHRVTTGEGRDGRHDNEQLSFHSLRHSAVTLLKEAGIPAAVVQEFIGHESAQISELYTTVGEESLTKAAAAFPAL
ncbi:MAG: tyrosine-type recombinase/integrase [Verrucomicrobiaceae bacterium]|nr:tyrosine-type recombinase/integrase [Verrucomicrobiaceae bacterium]